MRIIQTVFILLALISMNTFAEEIIQPIPEDHATADSAQQSERPENDNAESFGAYRCQIKSFDIEGSCKSGDAYKSKITLIKPKTDGEIITSDTGIQYKVTRKNNKLAIEMLAPEPINSSLAKSEVKEGNSLVFSTGSSRMIVCQKPSDKYYQEVEKERAELSKVLEGLNPDPLDNKQTPKNKQNPKTELRPSNGLPEIPEQQLPMFPTPPSPKKGK